MPRQFFVGGNFKMNPASRAQKNSLVETLNQATLDPAVGKSIRYFVSNNEEVTRSSPTEVVVAPPAIYLIPLQEKLRKDVKIAAQNSYLKPSGAFTGEIRYHRI